MPSYTSRLLLLSLLCLSKPSHASNSSLLWSSNTQQKLTAVDDKLRVKAQKSRELQINTAHLAQKFKQVSQSVTLTLPLPNGEDVRIKLTPSPILAADLASQYPQFMSYQAEQINAPQNIGRFSISHLGLFGMFRYQNQWMLLSPKYVNKTSEYASYWFKDDLGMASTKGLTEQVLITEPDANNPAIAQKSVLAGDVIRTYRLAISTTAEYTQKLGGSTDSVIAELMNLVNRINQILLIDLAVQFELIDNQELIFFDPDTDPYTNSDGATDIEANQQTVDNAIGSQHYDIGHLLSTNAGGLAYVGVLCNNSFKAQGYSGLNNPQGERFYIDLLAHELGHQLGAAHSFNADESGSCNDSRSSSSAYEPGSGSTIMGYAGICDGQNLQNQSDPYFHAHSIQAIQGYINRQSNQTCGVQESINNVAPQIQLSQNSFIIPANSPFVLHGAASDANNDPLTYSWEQYNNGGSTGATSNQSELNSDNGTNPLFRSFTPVGTAQRYLPRLSDVLAGTTMLGETYASTERNLTFRLTVRDNKGGVTHQDVEIAIKPDVEPISVSTPIAWRGFDQEEINWQVGDTALSPINCATVDILLDVNDQQLFDISLLSATANDGQHTVQVPNINSEKSRLMVKCTDNIFYAVNDRAFPILTAAPIAPQIIDQLAVSVDEDSPIEIRLADLIVDDPDSQYPEDFTLSVLAGDNYSVNLQVVQPDANFNGTLVVNVIVNDGENDSNVFALQLSVTPINDAPVAENDSITVQQNSGQISVDVLANDTDVERDPLSLSDFTYNGQGTVSISDGQLSYTPATGFSGRESINYTVSDGALSAQGVLAILVQTRVDNSDNNIGRSGGSLWYLLLISCLAWLARRVITSR